MKDRLLRFLIIFASIIASASATAAQAGARGDTQAFVVRAIFYTAPVSEKGRRRSTKGLTLDGGLKATEMFAELLKKGESEGKVSVNDRLTAYVRSGEDFNLYGCTSRPGVAVSRDIDLGKFPKDAGGIFADMSRHGHTRHTLKECGRRLSLGFARHERRG